MRRSDRPSVAGPPEATTDWMRRDIAERCREVLDAIAHPHSAVHLGAAAMVLRGASDDLVSLVELIEGSSGAEAADDAGGMAFGLAFSDVAPQNHR